MEKNQGGCLKLINKHYFEKQTLHAMLTLIPNSPGHSEQLFVWENHSATLQIPPQTKQRWSI